MVVKKNLPEKNIVENIPQTRGEKKFLRRLSSVLGFLSLKRGQPPKESQQNMKGCGKSIIR